MERTPPLRVPFACCTCTIALQSELEGDRMRPTRPRSSFTRLAKWTAHATGRPAAFGAAVVIVAVGLVSGPSFGFSDTWQLVINTGATIVTFLMGSLIQSTRNPVSA